MTSRTGLGSTHTDSVRVSRLRRGEEEKMDKRSQRLSSSSPTHTTSIGLRSRELMW